MRPNGFQIALSFALALMLLAPLWSDPPRFIDRLPRVSQALDPPADTVAPEGRGENLLDRSADDLLGGSADSLLDEQDAALLAPAGEAAAGDLQELFRPPGDLDEESSGRPVPQNPAGDDASVEDPHRALFARNPYPSAKECKTCHEQIYREWSVSGHAYAAISPMFHRFEQKMHDLTQGTIGYFCLRCHSPIGTTVSHSRDEPIWDAIPAAREGVTCIVCHRVIENYGKVNGERRIEPGDIFAPVSGPGHGATLARLMAEQDHYKLKTSPDDKRPGQPIHTGVHHLPQIATSQFCVSCHQVAVFPGIKLEVVWEQYRASPACQKGVRCHDCHMGAVPGKPAGYDTAPVAVVAGKAIDPGRRHSNHMFAGPGYSIAHPGLFPHNPKADAWSPEAWLQFDWRAGWGTEAFERKIANGQLQVTFPQAWQHTDDRRDARQVLEENLALLAEKTAQRHALMENSSKLEGPVFDWAPVTGRPMQFYYRVKNQNEGHNLPTGSLGAQPQLWLNVVLTGPEGQWLWESGYVDANGDLADLHSLEVAAGRVRRDLQLFNLQTKFLITHVKGTDREMSLPINVDFDPLPFIRPSGLPITTLNHPPFIRMEAHSLPPLGQRKARYRIPAHLVKQPGRYRLTVRMRSRGEPIYFMRFCGSSPEMERAMNEGILDFHQQAYDFLVQ